MGGADRSLQVHMGGAEVYRFIWEILITNRIKTIMQHSPGVVGGVAEAAAGDRVGMGPVYTRTNKSPWRMSIYPHGRESPCTSYPPSRLARYLLKDMWGHACGGRLYSRL